MFNGNPHINNNFKFNNGFFRNPKDDYIINYIYWIFLFYHIFKTILYN